MLFLNAGGVVTSHVKWASGLGGLSAALDDEDRFGVSVAGVGDLDGDGYVDAAVGAWGDDDGGSGGAAPQRTVDAEHEVMLESTKSKVLDEVEYTPPPVLGGEGVVRCDV